ncbi:MAG: hypothetical protein HKL80_02745 [Acidimicrobiales bacterium]|nr:hypothetical protein [Acidimicrobiales bacterium]
MMVSNALDLLLGTSKNPLHAYLLVGKEELTKAAAVKFAKEVVCEGSEGCIHCKLIDTNSHPDVVVIEKTGSALMVEEALEIIHAASRTPRLAKKRILIVPDVHLMEKARPTLLKTLEEPPEETIFVLLANSVPPDLVTIQSRCLIFNIAEKDLEGYGAVERSLATSAQSDEVSLRSDLWKSIPSRLDNTGASIALLVDELMASVDQILSEVKKAQVMELKVIDSSPGDKRSIAAMRKQVEERQRRELRRMRNEEFRDRLSDLAHFYLDRIKEVSVVGESSNRQFRAAEASHDLIAYDSILEAQERLRRNVNEPLLLRWLLFRLGGIEG